MVALERDFDLRIVLEGQLIQERPREDHASRAANILELSHNCHAEKYILFS